MLGRLYAAMAKEMVRLGVISPEREDIIIYGLDMLIYTVISISGLLALGAASNLFLPTALLLAAESPIQCYGGGFHAKTHLRCFTLMCLYWAAGMACYLHLPSHAVTLLCIPATAVIWILAPIEHENAPMSSRKRNRVRRRVRAYATALTIVTLLMRGRILHIPSITSLALFLCAVSMLAAMASKTTVRANTFLRH